ncbi:sentrin-specific protease 5 isoform X2 [Tyto alba]|uniref:sentrin-specific protease 5 isoform X2 n=1 Tax=Tyto alba TaxID=56313 RepID=UPI001C67CFA2|nr:sentrin-specific protease 5 isoform X2 [Tyto alba]
MLLQREWNGTCGPLTTIQRSKFNHHTVKNRSLFMMHKKLSMVRFRYRIIKSPELQARGKTCKLRKIKPRWVEKVTRDHQETLQRDFESGLCNWLSYWKSKSNCLWNRYNLSDMNNNTLKSLGEESEISAPEVCRTQDALPCAEPRSEEPGCGGQDGCADAVPPEPHARASPEAETLHQVETNGALAEDHCSDIFVSVTGKEIAVSGFLDEVMKKYGSLVPLCEKDVMGRLKEVFNEDFSHRKPFITREIMKYREKHPKPSTCNFRVFYNKHMLDMDDLATLEGQNWLNDQIINMYGELVMDAVPEKVHFFNSFFHRQLVTKGYNGVKRWTKKVDLFKKTLLLIPIHLEVHWSLITVNIPSRIISFYDSQGIHFKFCVENIRKYLLTEAKEKNRPEFLQGWQTSVTKCIPQQKNDSDCGVFVLQYCKCLALDQPFQFSQEDMPRVRKRIYKELCERQLID